MTFKKKILDLSLIGLVLIAHFKQPVVILEEEASIENLPPSDLWLCLLETVLADDWCRNAKSTDVVPLQGRWGWATQER